MIYDKSELKGFEKFWHVTSSSSTNPRPRKDRGPAASGNPFIRSFTHSADVLMKSESARTVRNERFTSDRLMRNVARRNGR